MIFNAQLILKDNIKPIFERQISLPFAVMVSYKLMFLHVQDNDFRTILLTVHPKLPP